MRTKMLKGIAVAAALSVGALGFAPKAQARHDDLPAIIAGLAIGAIAAHQVTRRHRHHYDHYRAHPRHYGPTRHRRDYRDEPRRGRWNRHHHRRHHY